MTKESILRYAYLSFLFFMLWGWVFRVTILFNQMMLYLICLVPLLLFVFACSRVGKKVTLWRVGSFIPFIIYSILCYLVQFDTYKVAQWLICLFILLSAKEITDNSISNKFIIGSGLFCWNIGTNAVAKFVLWIRLVFFFKFRSNRVLVFK